MRGRGDRLPSSLRRPHGAFRGESKRNRAGRALQGTRGPGRGTRSSLFASRVPTTASRALQSFARSRYSPVDGFTRTRSPVAMNSGTFTVTPFSSFAGFDDAVFV